MKRICYLLLVLIVGLTCLLLPAMIPESTMIMFLVAATIVIVVLVLALIGAVVRYGEGELRLYRNEAHELLDMIIRNRERFQVNDFEMLGIRERVPLTWRHWMSRMPGQQNDEDLETVHRRHPDT